MVPNLAHNVPTNVCTADTTTSTAGVADEDIDIPIVTCVHPSTTYPQIEQPHSSENGTLIYQILPFSIFLCTFNWSLQTHCTSFFYK